MIGQLLNKINNLQVCPKSLVNQIHSMVQITRMKHLRDANNLVTQWYNTMIVLAARKVPTIQFSLGVSSGFLK